MATLLLIRHAKAERPPGVADMDRDLSPRGERDAALLGRFLAVAFPRPRLVLTSPARRAHRTAEIVVAAAGWKSPIESVDRLYGGSVGDLLRSLAAADADPVVSFGHQPTWSTAVTTIMGGGAIDMVTGAAACLDGAPEPGGGHLRWMVTPASLGGGPA